MIDTRGIILLAVQRIGELVLHHGVHNGGVGARPYDQPPCHDAVTSVGGEVERVNDDRVPSRACRDRVTGTRNVPNGREHALTNDKRHLGRVDIQVYLQMESGHTIATTGSGIVEHVIARQSTDLEQRIIIGIRQLTLADSDRVNSADGVRNGELEYGDRVATAGATAVKGVCRILSRGLEVGDPAPDEGVTGGGKGIA